MPWKAASPLRKAEIFCGRSRSVDTNLVVKKFLSTSAASSRGGMRAVALTGTRSLSPTCARTRSAVAASPLSFSSVAPTLRADT